MGEFFLFFLVSLSAACLGWGMVVVASRIEHERQERYAERYGKKGPAVSPPKPSGILRRIFGTLRHSSPPPTPLPRSRYC